MRNPKQQVTIISIVVTLVFATACHSVRRGEPLTGPVDLPHPKAARGQVVFMNKCHQCHPNGEGGLGPALNNKPAPRFLIKAQVRTGFGSMPAFDKHQISREDLDDLVEYVVTLRRADHSTAHP